MRCCPAVQPNALTAKAAAYHVLMAQLRTELAISFSLYFSLPGFSQHFNCPGQLAAMRKRYAASKFVCCALHATLCHRHAGAYNVLMGQLRTELASVAASTDIDKSDVTKWLNLAAWFSCYVRLQQVGLVEFSLPCSRAGAVGVRRGGHGKRDTYALGQSALLAPGDCSWHPCLTSGATTAGWHRQ